ncbi:M16 family metallopeptidase [Thalassotalea agarivorans]|uniref:Predicted Zn-dependent peptidase n=1 Tax=Thalassotalea agarivorans TaxID=349064 RepID=A0A1I0ATZ9_THASX|nr:insulinase family protein [Thalassotalea agarivorans]SES97829.1 Predicted Zn-dependent peptidase [Thalassotalea agarivorans]
MRQIKRLTLVFIICIFQGCSEPEDVAREQSPSEQAPTQDLIDLITRETALKAQADHFIPVEHYQLDNGMKVVLSKDPRASVASLSFYYGVGYRNESIAQTGVSSLVQSIMMDAKLGDEQVTIAALAQQLGAKVNASVREDFSAYYAQMPGYKIEPFIWAHAKQLSHLYSQDYNLLTQKLALKKQRQYHQMNPLYGFPWHYLKMLAYRDAESKRSLFTTPQEKLDKPLINKFVSERYQMNNVTLVVTGNFDPIWVKSLVKSYFTDFKREKSLEELVETLISPTVASQTKTLPSIPKNAYAVAFHMPQKDSKDYLAMWVVSQWLLSKEGDLAKVFIDKYQITNQIEGGINFLSGFHFFNRDPALLTFSFIAEKAVSSAQVTSYFDEALSPLMQGALTSDLLREMKVAWRVAYYKRLEQDGGLYRGELLASLLAMGKEPRVINDIESQVNALNSADIANAMRQYVANNKRISLTVTQQSDNGGENEN